MDIIHKADATSQELKYYFTGKPCVRGHLSTRITKTGHCVECDRIRGAEYRKANPTKTKEWRSRNPEYASKKYHENKEARKQQTKLWYRATIEQRKTRHREWYYDEDTQIKLKAWRKQWYADNVDYDKAYYAQNYEKFKTQYRPGQKYRLHKKRKHINSQKFQELAQLHVLPESPSEHDFKYWIAGEIIRRTGWTVHKEVFIDLERTSRIDLLIPEVKIGIELKLSNHNWSSKLVEEQRLRYANILQAQGYEIVVVSLDGSLGIDARAFLESLSVAPEYPTQIQSGTTYL